MISAIRRCPRLQSTVAATVGARSINTSRQTLSHREISQRQCGLDVGPHNSKPLIVQELRQQILGKSMRTLSTLENRTPRLMTSENVNREFMAEYPDFVHGLTLVADRYESKAAGDWLKKAVDYNLLSSNSKNGLVTTLTYKTLAQDNLTAENLRLAHLLGWCVELLHSIIIIADDMVDNGVTRRDQLCWHKLEEVGLGAINDLLLMENGVYEFLSQHFRHLDYYVDVIEQFHQSCFKCISGQVWDVLLSKKNVSTFNMETYKALVRNKTACHFFHLPVVLGLYVAGIKDQKIFNECEAIAIELGNFFQVQNDFLDCFGNPEATGKIGTDIQVNKCSWLAVVCLEKASPAQKTILEACYGQNDPKKVARVKQLYEELNIPTLYFEWEEESYKRITALIQKTSESAPRAVLTELLNTIYHRDIK